MLTSAGAVEVVAPRVNDRRVDPDTGERAKFSSAILPPWCRRTPKITEVLPLLYLHGLSTSDFVPALGQFLGSTSGLSAPVITRLTETWKAEQRSFATRDLASVDYVYLWADGIHVNIRLEEHKLCLLVLVGVRADGRKELVALADGYRESTESWADLLALPTLPWTSPSSSSGGSLSPTGSTSTSASSSRSGHPSRGAATASLRTRANVTATTNRQARHRRPDVASGSVVVGAPGDAASTS